MIEWLKDLFKINKYKIVWNFKHHGVHLKGEYSLLSLGGMSKVEALRHTRWLNDGYNNPDSHWIEKIEK